MTIERPEAVVDMEEFAALGRGAGFQYFRALDNVLGADARFAMQECLKRKDTVAGALSSADYKELGFWYRTLTRSLLSYVEGLLYVMRQLTIHSIDRGELVIPPAEVTLLRELEYFVNVKRKRVEARESHNRLLENFILTFKHFPSVLGSTFTVDYGSHGWEKFQHLISLRNEITHPKSVSHVLLQPELPNTVRDAYVWFLSVMRDLFMSTDVPLLERSMQDTLRSPGAQRFLQGRPT